MLRPEDRILGEAHQQVFDFRRQGQFSVPGQRAQVAEARGHQQGLFFAGYPVRQESGEPPGVQPSVQIVLPQVRQEGNPLQGLFK